MLLGLVNRLAINALILNYLYCSLTFILLGFKSLMACTTLSQILVCLLSHSEGWGGMILSDAPASLQYHATLFIASPSVSSVSIPPYLH